MEAIKSYIENPKTRPPGFNCIMIVQNGLTQKNLFFVFSHCEDKNKCKVLLEHLYALLQIDPKVCPLKHGYFDNPISELTARLNQKIDGKEIRKDKKVVDSFVHSVKAL